jgi:hypothetical protein
MALDAAEILGAPAAGISDPGDCCSVNASLTIGPEIEPALAAFCGEGGLADKALGSSAIGDLSVARSLPPAWWRIRRADHHPAFHQAQHRRRQTEAT